MKHYKLLSILFINIILTGCGVTKWTAPMVVETETTDAGKVVTTQYTEAAYAQKTISTASAKSDCECTKLSDTSEAFQRDYSLLTAAGKPPNLCSNCSANVAVGRNYFDMKTEQTVARTSLGKTVVEEASGVLKLDVIGNTAEKIVSSVASNSGDRFNTEISGVDLNASNSSAGGDSLGTGGELLADGEIPSGDSLGGQGSASPSGAQAPILAIGSTVAVSGGNAAAGATAVVSGDGSVQSLANDSEVLESPTGGEQNSLDNSDGEGLDDSNGSNSSLLDL